MAKTFSTWPAPDAVNVSSGQALRVTPVPTLGEGINYVRAIYGRRDLVVAGFPGLSGALVPLSGHQAIETQTVYSEFPQAAWRVPVLPDTTEVIVEVEVLSTLSLDGWIKVVANSTTTEHAIGAGKVILPVDVDTASTFQTVEVYLRADSVGKNIAIANVSIYAEVLTSPHAAGAGSDGFCGVDEDEMAADEGLSSDLMVGIESDLGCIRDTPQTYFQWSGWRPVSGVAEKQAAMDAAPHSVVCPVWVGSWRDGYEIDVHVRAKSDPVDDVRIVIGVGRSIKPPYARMAVITVAAAAATDWHTTTIRLPQNMRVAGGMPAGWESVFMTVWPIGQNPDVGNLAADLHRTRDNFTAGAGTPETTAGGVLSVSAWGL